MSRADRFEFILDEDSEKQLYELLTSIDTRNTNRFCITDKRGYHAEYVKVRHGKWIADESTYTDGFVQCSVCKTTYYADDLYCVGEKAQSEMPLYCPHCGSKMMDGEEWTEKEYEYVTLHHEDIHFIDEDAERAFYESLAEREEE